VYGKWDIQSNTILLPLPMRSSITQRLIVCLSVCLSAVCLLAISPKTTDLIFWIFCWDVSLYNKEELIKFWKLSTSGFGFRNLAKKPSLTFGNHPDPACGSVLWTRTGSALAQVRVLPVISLHLTVWGIGSCFFIEDFVHEPYKRATITLAFLERVLYVY